MVPLVGITFDAPGPGSWELEAGHHGTRPLSGFLAQAYRRSHEAGTAVLLARYGLPLERVRAELVHGCLYLRPIGVGEGDAPSRTPPMLVLKVLARLHPELRRRNRTAAAAWASRQWRADVDAWFGHDRDAVVRANHAFQAVAVGALDDAALTAHLDELLAHFEEQARATLANHGGDLIPVGDLLAHAEGWGIGAAEVSALLVGSSPATTATRALLRPAADAVAASGTRPGSLDAVRALGPAAAEAVDAWYAEHAWRTVSTDDVDRPVLAERPGALLAALLAGARSEPPVPPDAEPVRRRVPAGERARFDALLAEASYGLRQRDDVVGVRWNWSVGLLRRALLEAGRRLADQGRLTKVDHVVELSPDELRDLLLRGDGPSAEELGRRAARRDEVQAAQPPARLGPPEPPPPFDALPAPMARAARALLTALEQDAAAPGTVALHGLGIGTASYVGRARVATSADDAIDRLEAGDILVAPFTGPAYNTLLPLLGALVVDHGGPMCHAAIAAREFGMPAVIGAADASRTIPDGAEVEVDPVTGTVRIVV